MRTGSDVLPNYNIEFVSSAIRVINCFTLVTLPKWEPHVAWGAPEADKNHGKDASSLESNQ